MTGDAAEREVEPGGRPRAPGRLGLFQQYLNSRNVEAGTDLFDDISIADRWLVDHGLTAAGGAVTTAADLERLVAIREAFRVLLAARHDDQPPPTGSVEAISAAATAGSLGVDIDPHGGLEVVATAYGLDGALARLILIATDAMATGEWARLKVCTNDECRWAFWDGSRNRSGRWCTMSLCGNQAKVQAHRRRLRS